MKLYVLLALTDQLRVGYKNMVKDFQKFFSTSQGAFIGVRNTYVPREGTIDEPKKRVYTPVTSTVNEKLDYFIEKSSEFIDALFSQEATNASGIAKAELVVDGNNWGEFTSLELLRLRSLIESKDLGQIGDMLNVIPVRSDSELWNESKEFEGRELFETPLVSGVNKSIKKVPRVLTDPNFQGKEIPAGYEPPIVSIDEIQELGDYTSQRFSGQWSHSERAKALYRRSVLLTAVTKALKQANDVTSLKSDLNAEKIFGYMFYGNQ